MARTKRIKVDETPLLSNTVRRRLREGTLILSGAVSLFLFLSLFSYHAADPGWSHTATHSSISNVGGRFGAWSADLLLYGFGYLTYLFPFMIIYSTYLLVRDWDTENERAVDGILITLRSAGFALFILSGCGLFSLLLPHLKAHLPFTSGGVFGNLVGHSLASMLNTTGASLLLTATLLSAITLFSGLSWSVVVMTAFQKVTQVLKQRLPTRRRLRREEPEITLFSDEDEVALLEAAKPVIKVPKKRKTAVKAKQSKTKVKTKKQTATDAVSAAYSEASLSTPDPQLTSEETDQGQGQSAPYFELSMAEGTLPCISLLDPADQADTSQHDKAVLEQQSLNVEQRLLDFGVQATVVAVHPGPVITRFELSLAPGVKVSKITGLAKDLARSMSTHSVRVVEVIPGKSVIGLELPNEVRETVRLSEILDSTQYQKAKSPLSLGLGKDISGNPVVVDLGKMPHLLVAGTTGSGKSVGLNAMLLSLLYKASPDQVRMILIDPKMLELSVYEGIPHLLSPVVTDMREAANALRWCVGEMERRYQLMSALGVRNIAGYNDKVRLAEKGGDPIPDPLWREPDVPAPSLQTLPNIVVVIDELADMMMVVGKKVEQLIARIAQKARAAGIHLILATQRPSVDVITGLIKSNIPTRIAFQVSSKVDSRTILDQQGADQLLGHGDMLYLPPGSGVPGRVHGAFVDDHEVHKVVRDWKSRGKPVYINDIVESNVGEDNGFGGQGLFDDDGGEKDKFYDEAVAFVTQSRKASISSIQRRFKVGYNRAARMIEEMENAGVVSAPNEGNGLREVIAPPPVVA